LRFGTPRSAWSGSNDILGPRVGAAGSSRKRRIYYTRCVLYYNAAEFHRNVVRIFMKFQNIFHVPGGNALNVRCKLQK